ncbi:hypothetical protein NDN16_06295 [Aureimonas altamirensis]|uniref:hypothetical protein n=1 Tax=Aureimonas altamirensis TaxID=370622 RepID=UPI0020368540|nr:hypothetical protein [Aureimonas altamirensis]MCM2503286.1 hypothetical protein [Aureimonas altamirensis]
MLGQFLAKVVTGEAGIFIARLRQMAVIYVLMAIVALFLLLFLLIAAFLWLAQGVGALPAALYFCGGLALLLVVLYVVLLVVGRTPKERASDRLQRDVASFASVAAVSNLPLILHSVKRRKGLLIIPVVGAALWAGLRAFSSRRNLR